MGEIKPIEQITKDIEDGKLRGNDAIMLELDESHHHHPVGYLWWGGLTRTEIAKELTFHQTSGLARTPPTGDDTYDKLKNNSVDISKGDYLGFAILGYKILERVEIPK